jgi:hypothetical protein
MLSGKPALSTIQYNKGRWNLYKEEIQSEIWSGSIYHVQADTLIDKPEEFHLVSFPASRILDALIVVSIGEVRYLNTSLVINIKFKEWINFQPPTAQPQIIGIKLSRWYRILNLKNLVVF